MTSVPSSICIKYFLLVKVYVKFQARMKKTECSFLYLVLKSLSQKDNDHDKEEIDLFALLSEEKWRKENSWIFSPQKKILKINSCLGIGMPGMGVEIDGGGGNCVL